MFPVLGFLDLTSSATNLVNPLAWRRVLQRLADRSGRTVCPRYTHVQAARCRGARQRHEHGRREKEMQHQQQEQQKQQQEQQ